MLKYSSLAFYCTLVVLVAITRSAICWIWQRTLAADLFVEFLMLPLWPVWRSLKSSFSYIIMVWVQLILHLQCFRVCSAILCTFKDEIRWPTLAEAKACQNEWYKQFASFAFDLFSFFLRHWTVKVWCCRSACSYGWNTHNDTGSIRGSAVRLLW